MIASRPVPRPPTPCSPHPSNRWPPSWPSSQPSGSQSRMSPPYRALTPSAELVAQLSPHASTTSTEPGYPTPPSPLLTRIYYGPSAGLRPPHSHPESSPTSTSPPPMYSTTNTTRTSRPPKDFSRPTKCCCQRPALRPTHGTISRPTECCCQSLAL